MEETSGASSQGMSRRDFGKLAGAVGIAGAAAAALAACGSSGGSSGPKSSTSGTGSGGASALSGNLTIWDWHYGHDTWGDALRTIDASFMAQHPNVKIKHVGQPKGQDYANLIRTALTSSTGPDVLMMQAESSAPQAVQLFTDGLAPLTTAVDKSTLSQFSAGSLQPLYKGGNPANDLYGLPASLQGFVFYYNKKHFTTAGLDPNSPPSTWNELVSAGQALNKAGITPMDGGNADTVSGELLFNLLWLTEATLADTTALTNGTMKWTDPKPVAVAQKFLDLISMKFLPPGFNSTPMFSNAIDSFSAGHSGMIAGLTSDAACWEQFNPALGASNVGIFWLGSDTAGLTYLPLGAGTAWSISAHTRNKDAAVAWIEYVTSPDIVTQQYKTGGVLPINMSVPVTTPTQPQQIVAQSVKLPNALPEESWSEPVLTALVTQLQLIAGGHGSVQSAMAKVEAARKTGN